MIVQCTRYQVLSTLRGGQAKYGGNKVEIPAAAGRFVKKS